MKSGGWFILALTCAVALGLGMVLGGLGPAIPDLAANTGTSRETAGAIFSALFIGALVAQLVSGPACDRFGSKRVLLVGIVLMLGGALFTTATSFPLLFALGVLLGLGHGGVSMALHILIAAAYPQKRVMGINVMNTFFGVGAVLAPALASLTLQTMDSALPGSIAGVVLIAVSIPFIWSIADIRGAKEEETTTHSTKQLYQSPLLWLTGILILVYVGVETGVSGWTSTYVERTAVLNAEQGALLTSGFWLMITIGRSLASWFSRSVSAERILLISLVGATLGGLLLLVGVGSTPLTIGAVLLLGLSFGPVFPTTISLTTLRFPNAPGAASSVVMAMGSLGGSSIPWMQGVILENVGTFPMAAYAAALASVMLVIWFVSSQWLGRKLKNA